ncbi:MAG: methyltransferase domain-containing protein [Candidatus Aminicenantes bacterium]|nr:methyltransferase domain-containing protein [Candidatus Aminicenantes bacterium]
MRPLHRKGFWYIPGRLYDLAFGLIFYGSRRRVATAVERDGLYPWLDVCCGTGSQFRGSGGTRGPVFGLDKSCDMIRYAAARAPGRPFVCGDAARLPFKDEAFRAVTVSFGLHDKSADIRHTMMAEARRVLAPGGRLVAVDFENPWNAKSQAGTLVVRAVERLAGGEHYRNGRDFLKRGGLRAFLRENGFVETARHEIEVGSISIVVASPR